MGGGYAMIPIMEREFVDKHQWMDRQEFMDIMVVAQTTPGIFAIDMASHIGYKLRGVWGGIVGALGIALPSIIAIMVIAMFFQNFKDNEYVAKFFRGVRPAVVALIAAPCFKMAKTANITWRTAWIPVACAALIWLLGVSPIYIIIAAGLAISSLCVPCSVISPPRITSILSALRVVESLCATMKLVRLSSTVVMAS